MRTKIRLGDLAPGPQTFREMGTSRLIRRLDQHVASAETFQAYAAAWQFTQYCPLFDPGLLHDQLPPPLGDRDTHVYKIAKRRTIQEADGGFYTFQQNSKVTVHRRRDEAGTVHYCQWIIPERIDDIEEWSRRHNPSRHNKPVLTDFDPEP